jgi:hypothetical protein
VPPASGYQFQDERSVDRFLVQRWIITDSPEVSPSGYCECITLVYEGDRKVLDLGRDSGITNVTAIRDVTGDRRAELVIDQNSGGAHCCASMTIYSVETSPRSLLSISTGNCPASLMDLDKDGTPEVSTCDDAFSYEFCSFAYSPFPPVVFAYDRRRAEFTLATPRFAKYLPPPDTNDARKQMDDNTGDLDIVRCAALGPALTFIYTGRVVEGQRLFRELYRAPDAAKAEQKAMDLVRKSRLWMAR